MGFKAVHRTAVVKVSDSIAVSPYLAKRPIVGITARPLGITGGEKPGPLLGKNLLRVKGLLVANEKDKYFLIIEIDFYLYISS